MITTITYNCDPESLGDVSQEDFAEAFENEVMVYPKFREAVVHVTFNSGPSLLVSIGGAGIPEDPVGHHDDLIRELAEKAFMHCCQNA